MIYSSFCKQNQQFYLNQLEVYKLEVYNLTWGKPLKLIHEWMTQREKYMPLQWEEESDVRHAD